MRFHEYFSRTLLGRNDPRVPKLQRKFVDEACVVQTKEEWEAMMRDFLTWHSVVLKTVILPPGVSLSDPRLPNAVLGSRRTYTLPVGYIPEFPGPTFEAELEGHLVPPAYGPVQGLRTRYQVINEEHLGRSESLAIEVAHAQSQSQAASGAT